LLAAAIAACSPAPVASQPASASSSAPAASGAGAPVAAAGGDLHAPRPLRGEPPGGSPRRKDPRWQRALAGDPLDLRALAQAEGATGLLEGVEDGGELFRAACEAIPLADDAEIALGRLGEIALLDDEALSAAAVVAIRRVAGSRPSRGEALDPDGVAYAARAVLSLSARTGLARERRARAISAARAFAERGVLDVASIPSDLDPAPADAP
jgi:hypothetical protein